MSRIEKKEKKVIGKIILWTLAIWMKLVVSKDFSNGMVLVIENGIYNSLNMVWNRKLESVLFGKFKLRCMDKEKNHFQQKLRYRHHMIIQNNFLIL